MNQNQTIGNMGVTLRKRKNSDGTTTLLLDVYHNGERKYEFLSSLKFLTNPSTPQDRQQKKDNQELAQKIAIKRAQELSASDYSMVTETGKNTIISEWMQTFVDGYKLKDKRNLQGSLNKFKNFLVEEKRHGLTFGKLDEVIISDFQKYLHKHSKGEGGSSYFNRFKKMVKQAYRKKLIQNNPAAEVKTKQGKAKKKDILTLDEINTLAKTSIESDQVKRAFLFSCVTGLRWIDVANLKWDEINLDQKTMTVAQSKTEREITVNLNATAIQLLKPSNHSKGLVFDLPTANGCNKTLKAWVKRAGIKKKITWHNARHSFGTNLIYYGADVTTASSLLGHSTLRHTQRYVTAANELKERATDKLNINL